MPTNSARNEDFFRRQAMYWLIAAGVIAAIWLIVWLTSVTPAISKAPADKEVKSADLALPSQLTDLKDLEKEVKPMDLSALVRDLRSYPPEFKDKKYFTDNKSRHTIQLMDVAENDVIVDYLNGRKDRDQFAYFRYLDKDEQPRYILTYGRFATQDEAKASLAKVNFELPKSIKPFMVSAGSYVDRIDSYELGQTITDLSGTQPRRVRLQATRNEIPAQAVTRADEELARRSQARIQAQQDGHQQQNQAQADRVTSEPNDQGVTRTITKAPSDAGAQPEISRLANEAPARQNTDLPAPPTIKPTANATVTEPVRNQNSEAPAAREPSRQTAPATPTPAAEAKAQN